MLSATAYCALSWWSTQGLLRAWWRSQPSLANRVFDDLQVANNRLIMGGEVNGYWTNVVGWATTAVMLAAAIGLLLTWGP